MTDTQPSIHDRLEAATGLNGDTLRGQLADQGLTVVVDETITDRAAIRDSADEREPERVCCDGGHANFPPLPDDPETTPEQRAGLDEVLAKVWPDPAPGATVAALDLDAIEADIAARRMLPVEQMPALVAEVRRLTESRATVAANLSASLMLAEAEVVTLRAKVAAVEALATKRDVLYPPKFAFDAATNYVNGYRQARDDFRAALATTGEGE